MRFSPKASQRFIHNCIHKDDMIYTHIGPLVVDPRKDIGTVLGALKLKVSLDECYNQRARRYQWTCQCLPSDPPGPVEEPPRREVRVLESQAGGH